jgi:hypothetical protein
MEGMISQRKALVLIFMGDQNVFHAFIDVEGAYGGVTLRRIVIAAYDDHRNPCILQLLKAPLEDIKGPDPGPDVMKDIACMDQHIGLQVDDPIHRMLKPLINHFLY